MTALLLLLLQQAPAPGPTVGDTVWIERVIPDPGGAVIRPQPWSLGSSGDQLGPAEVVQGERGLTVRYALVLWYPGEQVLTMPGPVLVRRDGSSDTLATSSYRLRVSSVLPAGARRAALAPEPARDTVPLVSRSLLPLAVLVAETLLVLLLVTLRWRRRGKAPPPRPNREVFAEPEQLRRWADAGEYRAALDGWSWRMARRLAYSRDLEECARLQRLLDDIADGVYTPAQIAPLSALCERASQLEAA